MSHDSQEGFSIISGENEISFELKENIFMLVHSRPDNFVGTCHKVTDL